MSSTAYGSGPTGLSGTHYGGAGLGCPGSLAPAFGLHGPSPLYKVITLPADANKQYMFRVNTIPAGVTGWTMGEDSAFDGDGADGPHVGSYSLYEDGVLLGADSFTIVFGAGLTGGATLDGVAAGGGLGGGVPSAATGGAVLDDVAAGGGLGGQPPSILSGTAVLDGVSVGGAIQVASTPTERTVVVPGQIRRFLVPGD